MIDLQYHKGQKCLYGSTFCQEGFCSACNIYQKVIPENVIPAKRLNTKESSYGFLKVGSLQPV